MARTRTGLQQRRTSFVVDCSVTMAWFFSQEATAYTNAVRQYLKVAEAIVPDVWPYEIANVLYIGLKHGRPSPPGAK